MKVRYVIPLLIGCIINCSCGDTTPPAPPQIPTCEWTSQEDISVTPVALRMPAGMNSFFKAQAPSDGVFRTLTHPLWKGDYKSSSNEAEIYGDLISDGSVCDTDIMRMYEYVHDDNRIRPNYLRLMVPEQGFVGLAKMTIRSDDYKTSDPDVAEFVLWAGSSSNPDFPTIYGSILGERKTYNTRTNRIILYSEGTCSYFNNGTRFCF